MADQGSSRRIAALLLVPIRHRRWAAIAAAALLAIGVLVSIASVGLFYVPSAALLVVAARHR